jgi:hypothetical protein
MIKPFKSAQLSGGGYQGSLLKDHREGSSAAQHPYLWAKCDWCGQQGYLDDDGEHEPYRKFEELLGWVSFAPPTGNKLFHFCTRKCRISFIDRHGSATMVH